MDAATLRRGPRIHAGDPCACTVLVEDGLAFIQPCRRHLMFKTDVDRWRWLVDVLSRVVGGGGS